MCYVFGTKIAANWPGYRKIFTSEMKLVNEKHFLNSYCVQVQYKNPTIHLIVIIIYTLIIIYSIYHNILNNAITKYYNVVSYCTAVLRSYSQILLYHNIIYYAIYNMPSDYSSTGQYY